MTAKSGYIYIFLRADGLRKLGWTTRIERRRQEHLKATGIVHTFEMAWEMGTRGAHRAEQMVHGALRQFHHPSSKEVYDLPLAALIEAVDRVMGGLSDNDLMAMYPPKPLPDFVGSLPTLHWPTLIREADEQLRADPDLYRAMIARFAEIEVVSSC